MATHRLRCAAISQGPTAEANRVGRGAPAAKHRDIPPEHFLSIASPSNHPVYDNFRLNFINGTLESDQVFEPWTASERDFRSPQARPDTSTLAAADFDVDVRTGFLPPEPPVNRLPPQYDAWEDLLVEAKIVKLALGRDAMIHDPITEGKHRRWRRAVRAVSDPDHNGAQSMV